MACANDACPFYLAQLDLEAVSSMSVSLTYGAASLSKVVSDVTIELARPALGMWLPDSDDVIFPPNTLAFRVGATVSGATNWFGEDGSYDYVYRLNQYVFGSIAGGVLHIRHSDEDTLGQWIVDAFFVPE